MTLIEVMIALLIVAGLFALVLPSIQAVAGVQVKESAGRLAGAIRYLYDHTAITGQTCRLTFDMAGGDQSGEYAAECTKGNPRLAQGQVDVRDGEVDKPDDSPFANEHPSTDQEKFEARIKQKAQWAQFKSNDVHHVQLPADVHIVGVWTGRLTAPVTKGEAHLYFFPMGETEKAYIWLQDENDHTYTLTVQRLTGRVKVHARRLEVPNA